MAKLSDIGDLLERINSLIDFKLFRDTQRRRYCRNCTRSATNITIYGQDTTATASQKLTLTVGSLNNVSVNGGKFILSNATASTGKLSINGGTYESAGITTFANIDLTAGAIAFANTANMIAITGNAQKSGMDKFAIDFEGLSVDSLKDNSNWYDILSVNGTNSGFSEDANNDFFAKNLSKAFANFRWDNGKLQVSFTQVPEPSTIAALFALAAFGIVLARKRS